MFKSDKARVFLKHTFLFAVDVYVCILSAAFMSSVALTP